MTDFDDSDVIQFQKEGRRIQEDFFKFWGNEEWHEICKETILLRIIGFGLYGPALSARSPDNFHTGFDGERLTKIKEIYELLTEASTFPANGIQFACIFIVRKENSDLTTFPIFKCKEKNSNSIVLVDGTAKKYCSWDDFEAKKESFALCCYPTSGRYSEQANGQLELTFSSSLESDVHATDISTVALIGAESSSNTCHAFLRGIIDEEREIPELEYFQYCDMVLFHENREISLETAKTELANTVIQIYKSELKEGPEVSLFYKHLDVCNGNSSENQIIISKELLKIGKTKFSSFYRHLTTEGVQNDEVKLSLCGYNGMVNCFNTLMLHSSKALEMPSEDFNKIIHILKEFDERKITKPTMHALMRQYCKLYYITPETMRTDTRTMLCEIYEKSNISEIEIGRHKIFATSTDHEIDRLHIVFCKTLNRNEETIKIVNLFAASRNCDTTDDFINYAEFVNSIIKEEINLLEEDYQHELSKVEKKSEHNRSEFDKERGIVGKRQQFFRTKVMEQFSNDNKCEILNEKLISYEQRIVPLNDSCKIPFFNYISAIYHYIKHNKMGPDTLTPEDFFKLAEKVVDNPTSKKHSVLSQDGSCTISTYLDHDRAIKVIVIERSHGSGIATILFDPGEKSKS